MNKYLGCLVIHCEDYDGLLHHHQGPAPWDTLFPKIGLFGLDLHGRIRLLVWVTMTEDFTEKPRLRWRALFLAGTTFFPVTQLVWVIGLTGVSGLRWLDFLIGTVVPFYGPYLIWSRRALFLLQ